ncbi:MAG: GTP-binding protein, partial [Candidatus Curtissbacteria bacterium]
DIAILVVSAEDGVKPQTIEAWKTINEMKLPAIIAINKIDLPNANVEKTKQELAESEIYLENYGGKIPYVEISAKTGVGIDNLLSLILLLAEMEDLKGDVSNNASGFVIEVNLDSRRGIMATLIIKEGTLRKGMYALALNAICSTRIIENFQGKMIDEAVFSSPVRIFGFDQMPQVGVPFQTFENKKDAQKHAKDWQSQKGAGPDHSRDPDEGRDKKIIPILLKADVSGTLEAIEKEILKINNKTEIQSAEFKIINKGVGPISESDLKTISTRGDAIIIGFNVKADKSAVEIAQQRGITISFFDIIYKMTEWLEIEMENRRPKVETMETTGRAKILRAFSRTKERQILGGKVIEGRIVL